VLLIGGSSRIPLVAEMLTEALGRPVVADTHPKYAVALGAAALAAQVDPPRQIVTAAPALSALCVGVSDADGPRARATTRLPARSQVLVLAGNVCHLDGPTSTMLEVGSSTPRTSAPSAVALLERLPALAAAGHTNGGWSPLALVGTGHTLADPIDARERTTPALSRVLVGALALAGLTSAGFLTHRSGSPVLSIAAPAQACTTDCDRGLPPSSSSRPDPRAPVCSPFSDMPPGCESAGLTRHSTHRDHRQRPPPPLCLGGHLCLRRTPQRPTSPLHMPSLANSSSPAEHSTVGLVRIRRSAKRVTARRASVRSIAAKI